MAKKKPPEEHENLERYLVSYADFMTLMFATFVVLYALAQSDVNSFKNIEDALKKAFTQNIFDNQASIMEGTDSMFEGQIGATTPLMLEYMSQKYEQTSYESVKEDIENLKEDGISTQIDERGLVIRFNEQALHFAPNTAELSKESLQTLDKVAKIIREKFAIHYLQIEGHTDSDPVSKGKYPTNWELSAARACAVVRHLITHHNFNKKLFIATGLADTIPIVKNTTPENKAKNRRVEIIILKNKNKHLSKKNMQEILDEVKLSQKKNKIKDNNTSEAVQGLVGNDKELLKNVIDMSDTYDNETKRLNSLENGDYVLDGQKPKFME